MGQKHSKQKSNIIQRDKNGFSIPQNDPPVYDDSQRRQLVPTKYGYLNTIKNGDLYCKCGTIDRCTIYLCDGTVHVNHGCCSCGVIFPRDEIYNTRSLKIPYN
jgi:hypothetical protein